MARRFPTCQFIGIDLLPPTPGLLTPPNVSFEGQSKYSRLARWLLTHLPCLQSTTSRRAFSGESALVRSLSLFLVLAIRLASSTRLRSNHLLLSSSSSFALIRHSYLAQWMSRPFQPSFLLDIARVLQSGGVYTCFEPEPEYEASLILLLHLR